MRRIGALLLAVAAALGDSREGGGFAGVAVCARCHGEEAEAWRSSPHGRHAIAVATPEGGADAAVGSRWMQAYLRKDPLGYHRIVPLCRDLRDETWRNVVDVLVEIRGDPAGFREVPSGPLESRSFEIDCAGCHTSRPRLALDPSTGAMRSSWDDAALDCEACHGPGAHHAEAWARLDASSPMPRLESLPSRAATAVCARCHGGPPTGSEWSPADAATYVAAIDDSVGFFPDGSASGQVYQSSGFAQSACGLRCGDCHDPHGPGLRPFATEDAMCTRCHEKQATRAHTFHDPRGAGARCVECHMPRVLGGIMAHQRDHRIASPLPQTPHAPDACTACHRDRSKAWASDAYRAWWGDPPAATLDAILGIFLARAKSPGATPLLRTARSHRNPFFRANAAIYLGDPEAALADPAPEVRLAGVRAAARSDDPETWLRRALDDREPRVRAAGLVERIRFFHPLSEEWRADLEIAARQLRDAPEVRLALGVWLLRDGRPLDAENAFQGALAFRPLFREGWLGLACALGEQGREEEARAASSRHVEALVTAFLRSPSDATLAVDAATALVASGRNQEAAGVLRRAATQHPPGPTRESLARMLRRLDAP